MKFVCLLFKGKLQRIIFKVFRITFFFWVCALCEACHLGKKLTLFSKFLISSFIHNNGSSGWEGAFYLFRLKSSFKNCKVNPLWWWWFSHSVVSDSCNPMDCSPPGSSVHGILQARVLEWVPFPPLGGLPDPGVKPASPSLQADSFLWDVHSAHMHILWPASWSGISGFMTSYTCDFWHTSCRSIFDVLCLSLPFQPTECRIDHYELGF